MNMEHRITLLVDRKVNLGVIEGEDAVVEIQLRKEKGKSPVLAIYPDFHGSMSISGIRDAFDEGRFTPSAGISIEEVEVFLDIWTAWNLNDLSPSPDGTRWCFKELPAEVIEFIKRFGKKGRTAPAVR